MKQVACLVLDVAEYPRILPSLGQQADPEVVGMNDRFKAPAFHHYRDLKIRVRLKSGGRIATFHCAYDRLCSTDTGNAWPRTTG